MLAPWAIRNQVQFGRPIVTTTHGGYTLLLANNPDFYQWLSLRPVGRRVAQRRTGRRLANAAPGNELQADRLAYREAWATIRQQPERFAYACLVRLGRLWSPLPHRLRPDESAARRWSRWPVAAWYAAEFLLASLGVWRLGRRQKCGVRSTGYGVRSTESGVGGADRPDPLPSPPSDSSFNLQPSSLMWGFLLVGCVTAVHTVYWTDMRMRGPLMPVVAIAAIAALARGWVSGYDGGRLSVEAVLPNPS